MQSLYLRQVLINLTSPKPIQPDRLVRPEHLEALDFHGVEGIRTICKNKKINNGITSHYGVVERELQRIHLEINLKLLRTFST